MCLMRKYPLRREDYRAPATDSRSEVSRPFRKGRRSRIHRLLFPREQGGRRRELSRFFAAPGRPWADNGSGDKTWDFVWALCAAAAAVVVALAWSLAARRTPTHARRLAWFRVVLRRRGVALR